MMANTLISIIIAVCAFSNLAIGLDRSAMLFGERSDYINAIKKADKYFSDKNVIDSVGPLFLKHLYLPGSVDVEEIPQYDAYRRLFGQQYTLSDVVLKRLVSDTEKVKELLRNNRLQLNNYYYSISDKYGVTFFDPFDDILIKALYCDITGFDDLDFYILSMLRDSTGNYYDTHNLVALYMLEGNGCYDPKAIQKQKEAVVADLVKALKKDTQFSDLYAERVACLFWAGARNKVQPEWIELIKNAQNPDGGWSDIGQVASRAHPSGLAALSIKYFVYEDLPPVFYDKVSQNLR